MATTMNATATKKGRKTEYQIVGRYMNGKEVTGYHLQSLSTGTAGRFNKEQVAYLVGHGQVTNCEGQIYQDKVLLRGVGVSLDALPCKQEATGAVSRTGNVGRVRKGSSAESVMEQFMITGRIVNGRNVIGYTLRNAGGGEKDVPRNQVLEAARAGKIGNARVQMWKGQIILKGVNCDIRALPTKDMSGQTQAPAAQKQAAPVQRQRQTAQAPVQRQAAQPQRKASNVDAEAKKIFTLAVGITYKAISKIGMAEPFNTIEEGVANDGRILGSNSNFNKLTLLNVKGTEYTVDISLDSSRDTIYLDADNHNTNHRVSSSVNVRDLRGINDNNAVGQMLSSRVIDFVKQIKSDAKASAMMMA